jgi:hypothetical protein
MRLARLVDDGGLWVKCRDAAKDGFEQAPPQSILSFIPSPKDEGWLSLFRVNDDDEAEFVAAAIRYNQGEILACHMAIAHSEKLQELGLKIRKSPGKTYHAEVNDIHYEVNVASIDDLNKIAGAFLAGEYSRIETPRVLQSLQVTAKAEKIDFSAIVESTSINGKVATRTLELVKSKHLAIAPHP